MPDCSAAPYCGDGATDTAWGEECDNAGANQDGLYDGCSTIFELNAYCGDGIRQASDEACDESVNDGTYGECDPDCSLAAFCGDGTTDDTFGEQCDDGGANQDGLYDRCSTSCMLGPHCGDGTVQGGDGELCDDGTFTGGTLTCTGDCTLDTSGCEYCGNGVAEGTESCDGSDTAGVECVDLPKPGGGNYVGGQLSCNATCDGYDESGCHTCSSCWECGGQACADNQCGNCVTTADCCPGMYCQGGTCYNFGNETASSPTTYLALPGDEAARHRETSRDIGPFQGAHADDPAGAVVYGDQYIRVPQSPAQHGRQID